MANGMLPFGLGSGWWDKCPYRANETVARSPQNRKLPGDSHRAPWAETMLSGNSGGGDATYAILWRGRSCHPHHRKNDGRTGGAYRAQWAIQRMPVLLLTETERAMHDLPVTACPLVPSLGWAGGMQHASSGDSWTAGPPTHSSFSSWSTGDDAVAKKWRYLECPRPTQHRRSG